MCCWLSLTTAVTLVGCGQTNTVASDAGATVGSGTPAVDGGTSAVDGGAVVVGGCPRVILGSTLPAEFSADTTGLTNLVTSNRLEWTDAPDDAIEFMAPATGDYVIELSSTAPNLGVSAQDFNTNGSDAVPFTRSNCPAAGSVKAINGVFSHLNSRNPISLSAGQSIVMFVSAPFWAPQKAGAYVITVRKLP